MLFQPFQPGLRLVDQPNQPKTVDPNRTQQNPTNPSNQKRLIPKEHDQRQNWSPIGLAGCGIWFFFAAIFGIWAENRGGKQELQFWVGARFHDFMGLGCEIRKGNRAGHGNSILIRDVINCYWPAPKTQAGRNETFVRFAVSGFKLWQSE